MKHQSCDSFQTVCNVCAMDNQTNGFKQLVQPSICWLHLVYAAYKSLIQNDCENAQYELSPVTSHHFHTLFKEILPYSSYKLPNLKFVMIQILIRKKKAQPHTGKTNRLFHLYTNHDVNHYQTYLFFSL